MSHDTGKPGRIRQAVQAAKARVHALPQRERELTIALMAIRAADATPGPGASDAELLAQRQQRSAPVRAASLHVRHLTG
jgi:hypothetical protein